MSLQLVMKNNLLTLLFLIILTIICFFSCLACGGQFINPFILFADNSISDISNILLEIRFYRLINVVIVGGALASSGLAYQAVLRNPLADPYVLGISGGASIGAALAISTGITIFGSLTLPVFAFSGALIVLSLVLLLAKGAGEEYSVNVILSGVVIGSVCSSVLMFLISVMNMRALHNITWWMLGSFQAQNRMLILICFCIVVPGVVLLFIFGRDANILSFGDEAAFHFGISPKVSALILLGVASLLTAAAVSLAGIIGFIGLIVPHILRKLFGADHRKLFPLSFFAGAIFLMVCDTFARSIIYPTEIPVGVITASLGGPFFLWLINSQKKLSKNKRIKNARS